MRRQLKLQIINGPEDGREFLLVNIDKKYTLGRAKESVISLPYDFMVSRTHAQIEVKRGGDVWLTDLGSRNGTIINGECINKPYLLRIGEIFKVGNTFLQLIED